MAETKKLSCAWSETGQTVYGIIRREVDGYRLDDVGGSFAAAPADPYLSFTEDAVIKGVYEVSESRAAWDNGTYLVTIYKQAGGSPVPASDTVIAAGEIFLSNDAIVSTLSATVVLPVMQGQVYTATALSGRVVKIVRGDTPRITFDLGDDYTGWTARFGAKLYKGDSAYAIEVKDCTWTDEAAGQGYVDLTAAETSISPRDYRAEIELVNGIQHLTAMKFTLSILEDVIDN